MSGMQVHTLDLRFQEQPHLIASYLVECGSELALVEAGPGSTLPVLLEGIAALGFEASAIRHVFVTHIHLDHAGAAGWWAQQGGTVYVHPRGAAHLVDPSKLMASAALVYGDRMEGLWGKMLPAPADKVVSLKDGEQVKVGNVKFTALDTPGHARHHHAYVCGDACFTGDVAGMRLPGTDYLSVTAAPPQFDPVAYQDSITRLHEAGFGRLYLTHFGEVTDVSRHLAQYAFRVQQVHECIQSLLDAGLDGEALRQAYGKAEHQVARDAGVSEAEWVRCESANSTAMCADGIALFCRKQH